MLLEREYLPSADAGPRLVVDGRIDRRFGDLRYETDLLRLTMMPTSDEGPLVRKEVDVMLIVPADARAKLTADSSFTVDIKNRDGDELSKLTTQRLTKVLNKYDDALKAMSAAADVEDKSEKHPVTPGVAKPARELYGVMLLERGMSQDALVAFEATLKKEPNRLGAYAGAAKAAEKSGDKAKARQYCEKIVAIAGNADKDRTEVVDARAFLRKS